MALFHMNVTQIKRSNGQSAIAAAAYRVGEKLHSEYYGEVSDYTNKHGVICSEILLPNHAPREYADRQTLWNAVEKAERGKNAQLAYSFDIALQNEFSMEENIALARHFLLAHFVSRGMVVDFAVHVPDIEPGGISNPHFHVMSPIRPIEENGKWGCKQHRVYELDEEGNRLLDADGNYIFNAVPTTDWRSPETLEYWREQWAAMCNAKFEEKNLPCRIDHRSYERQGVDLLPTIHEGPSVRQMEAKGIRTDKGEFNRWIKATNAVIREIKKKIAALLDWLKEAKEELSKPQTPDLISLLQIYFDQRNSGAYSQKARANNLKELSEIITFLQENGITDVESLEAFVSEKRSIINEKKDQLDAQTVEMKDLRKHPDAWDTYKRLKPVADKVRSIKFTKAKEKYKAEHKAELNQFYAANRLLTKYFPDGKYNSKAIQARYAELEQQHDDDWLKIQFQFLINEMPVTDTSKKVKNVIRRRQLDGEWICAAPYGYIINDCNEFEIVPTEADIVRKIFHLYNVEGWGYKKIANHLTDQGIPTPRMCEQMRKEAKNKPYNRKVNAAWAIITVQGILDNDFYIGTFRQAKYTRAKINGKDVKRDEGEHIVIENHHQSIIDYRTFAITRELREKRTRSNYRGVKKYDNVYSGFLECGDCGSPMFSLSRPDLAAAYTCGTYHKRGRSGGTSHHIRVDTLDELLRTFIRKVMENSSAMLEKLNAELSRENDDIAETEQSADHLAEVLAELQEELKTTKRQRIREIMKKPEQEAVLEELYDELEAELIQKIDGLNHQIDMLADKRNTIILVNLSAKTTMDVFRDILEKEALDRNDLELIIDRIKVYEDHLDIQLKADIDILLKCGLEGLAANFKSGIEDISLTRIVQKATHQKDKVFDVNVISECDSPLNDHLQQ